MNSLEEVKRRLEKNYGNLKEMGVVQEKISELLKYISKGKITYSQGSISRSKKWTKLGKVKKLVQHTDDLLDYIAKHPEILELQIVPSYHEIEFDEMVTWSSVVDRFVSREIKRFNNSNYSKEPLIIEAIGMKLMSLLNVLHFFYMKGELPICHLKCIVIDPDECGFVHRHIIEGERPEYKNAIKTGFLFWKAFQQAVVNDEKMKGSEFEMRWLKPDPNFYMIRIGNKMLVSVYLRDLGNTNSHQELDAIKDKKKFNDFYNFYVQYFSNDKLSSDLNWNHEIFVNV